MKNNSDEYINKGFECPECKEYTYEKDSVGNMACEECGFRWREEDVETECPECGNESVYVYEDKIRCQGCGEVREDVDEEV